MTKRRQRKSHDPFESLTDTLKFGTTTLVSLDVFNTVASKIRL